MKYLKEYKEVDFEDWDIQEEDDDNDYSIYFILLDKDDRDGFNDGWRFYPTYKKQILGRDKIDSLSIDRGAIVHYDPKEIKPSRIFFLHKLRQGDFLLSNCTGNNYKYHKQWTLEELCEEYPQYKKYL